MGASSQNNNNSNIGHPGTSAAATTTNTISSNAASTPNSSSAKLKPFQGGAGASGGANSNASSYLSFTSASAAFQQVKQTQASLARLSRVQQQLSQTNQSSHHHQQHQQVNSKESSNSNATTSNQQQQHAAPTITKSTTFVDCLIRRFKDCFSEDFCTVPMFVVGNLSPGSDGTHLILPPCISLGRQNISRFASPKNLRLINSIRESCKPIEELDLGGNKLTDLIEVYKILQCTPNIRFLNLSENDLSRTSPVAMAATCSTAPSSTSPPNSSSLSSSSASSSSAGHPSSSNSNSMTFGQRACLAPINQNQHQQTAVIGSRRHSTLGQVLVNSSDSSSGSGGRTNNRHQPLSRVAEARRLAAAAAVAQSKKTSSSVASKLTNSAAGSSLSHRQKGSSRASSANDSEPKTNRCPLAANQRHQSTATSTMHLARSLSSLSAKDARATSSSLGRLSVHRTIGRSESGLRSSTNQRQRQGTPSGSSATQAVASSPESSTTKHVIDSKGKDHKLFVEPIVETDDVEMSEQQQMPLGSPNNSGSSSNNERTLPQPIAIQQQSRALATLHAGNSLTRGSFASPTTTTTSQSSPNFRRTFESIKALALNNTGCQWRVVCSILSRMPNLEELHLSLNNYERIDLEPNDFKHHSLKRLYLCNNPKLTNWEELDKLLIAFPSLQALSIADCNISQIPENLDRAREWRKLCGLNINGWPIKEWPVIERLNQLPSLIDLKCRNLDVLNTIDEPRHHLIARLPKLQRLNGSEIEEREHAEKAFLRFFMANSHLERPSRFHELVQIHGEVTPVDVDVDLSPPSHAHVRVVFLNRNFYRKENKDDILMSEDFLMKLMDVNVDANTNVVQQNNFESMEVSDVVVSSNNDNDVDEDNKLVRLFKDEGQEVLAIDVDLRQSVRKFKSTLASLFGLSSPNLILYYIDHEMVGLMGPELIKHNQKKLWNYNVQDGDQFIVEER